MLLGDALNRRADLKARIHQIATRLPPTAVTQEGEGPPEDPETLLRELDEMSAELERLVAAINETNAQTRLPDGRSLTAALAERDVLTLRHSVLRSAAETIATGAVRATAARS